MSIVIFVLIIGGALASSVIMGHLLDRLTHKQLVPIIIHRIDRCAERWLRGKPEFRDHHSRHRRHTAVSASVDAPQLHDALDMDAIAQDFVNTECGFAKWSQIVKIGCMIAMYMICCNFFIYYLNSLYEVLIGTIISVSSVIVMNRPITDAPFLQGFAVMSLIPSVSLIVIRNCFDTYRIGMWVFSLHSVQLYITQWLGLFLVHLVQRSLHYHKNSKNIALLWGLIFCIIAIL